jgi:CIC family chloride channel protein
MRFGHIRVFYRLLAAGLIGAGGAWLVPQVMGIGYDTVNHALLGNFGLVLVIGIALVKIVVTASTVGLGMPMGLVGPTFFIGATIGCALGLIAQLIMPGIASSPGFYAMLGMGAMMGSVLQAPLAALMALLEMTQNTNIILPGMLIIVVSSMVASEVFGQQSVFLTVLRQQGLNYQHSPMSQALQRVGVAAIMERHICQSDKVVSIEQAAKLLSSAPKWVLINNPDGTPISLLPPVDLARCLEQHGSPAPGPDQPPVLDLLEIPAQRRDLAPLHFQATLLEALDRLNATKTEALYVERGHSDTAPTVLGVVLRNDIESYYQRPNS